VERVIVKEVERQPTGQSDSQAATPATDEVVETVEEIAVRLEQAFELDAPASSNARELERTVAQQFKLPEAEGSRLRAVECRATRCRLEIEFRSSDVDRAVMRRVFVQSDTPVSRMAMTAPVREARSDGSVVATVYLSPPTPPLEEPDQRL
jgi:hypothetical protein